MKLFHGHQLDRRLDRVVPPLSHVSDIGQRIGVALEGGNAYDLYGRRFYGRVEGPSDVSRGRKSRLHARK